MEYFYSQPSMAGVILGASMRIEERIAAGEAVPRAIGTFKVGLMGSLGAIGDAYFWGALKPMASSGCDPLLVHPPGVAACCSFTTCPTSRSASRIRCGMAGEETAAAPKARFASGRWTARSSQGSSEAWAGAAEANRHPVRGGGRGSSLVLAVQLTVLFRKAVSPSEVLLFLLIIGTLILL
jgi:hypothetical protein